MRNRWIAAELPQLQLCRQSPAEINAGARADDGQHERRHYADPGAKPPAYRAANNRAYESEEFGHTGLLAAPPSVSLLFGLLSVVDDVALFEKNSL